MLYVSIPILFLLIGIVAGVSIPILIHMAKNYSFKWHSWLIAISGLTLILFTIAWSVTSVLEGEPQAAGMGLIFFGVPGTILIFLCRRLMVKDTE